METSIGQTRASLAVLFEKGLFAAMGVAGLLLLVGLLLFGTPYDGSLVGAIAAAFIGIGFGEAECRKWEVYIHPDRSEWAECRRLCWQLTPTGMILHIIGWSGAIVAAVKVLRLL